MDSKLYVGNLAFSTTETELKAVFAQAGRVASVRIIRDHISGSSKGFAFLEMGTPAEAEKAVNMLNGYSLSDRALKVLPARPPEEVGPRRGGFREPRRQDSGSGKGQGNSGVGRNRPTTGKFRR
jgi:RNA recognition motif-containing protein